MVLQKQHASIYWRQLSSENRAAVEAAVAMDLWERSVNSTMARVPQVQDRIVRDPFHLGRMLNEAVDHLLHSPDLASPIKRRSTGNEPAPLFAVKKEILLRSEPRSLQFYLCPWPNS